MSSWVTALPERLLGLSASTACVLGRLFALYSLDLKLFSSLGLILRLGPRFFLMLGGMGPRLRVSPLVGLEGTLSSTGAKIDVGVLTGVGHSILRRFLTYFSHQLIDMQCLWLLRYRCNVGALGLFKSVQAQSHRPRTRFAPFCIVFTVCRVKINYCLQKREIR